MSVILLIFYTVPLMFFDYALKGAEELKKAFFPQKIQRKANRAENPTAQLLKAVHCKDFKTAQLMIQLGADVNVVEEGYQSTALHIAVFNRDLSMAQLLIQWHANVNAKNKQSDTPLHLAVRMRDVWMAQLLIQWHANVNEKNKEFDTPLHLAVRIRDVWMAQLLIQSHANVNEKDASSWAPLYSAILGETEHLPMVQLLIQFRATVDIENNLKQTPLIGAAENGNLPAAQLLIQSGANVNAADIFNRTPLYVAAGNGYLPIVQLLLQTGADVNATVRTGHTDLYNAFQILIRRLTTEKNPSNTNPCYVDLIYKLIKLLSWYIYKNCMNAISLSSVNRATIFQYLQDAYQSSLDLRQADPVLSWLFSHMLECTSRVEFIEKTLQHLELVDEKQQNDIIENMDFLFLEEIPLTLKELKEKFSCSILEKLKNISRYRYAQKIEKEIFKNIFRSRYSSNKEIINKNMKAFMDLNTIKNNAPGLIDILNELKTHLVEYCKHTLVKSPFLTNVLNNIQINETTKILSLAEEWHPNKSKRPTSKEASIFFIQNLDTTLMLIKEVKAHLDYIIEKKGTCLNSPSSFGRSTDLKVKDMLEFAE